MPFKKGYIPWNKGMTKENNMYFAKVVERRKGRKLTEEHKKHLREARKDLFTLQWFINKYGSELGSWHYKERCNKISESHKNKKRSEETKKKISEMKRGTLKGKNNPNYNSNAPWHKPNYCIDCGKKINYKSIRCCHCSRKQLWQNGAFDNRDISGEKNGRWIDGRAYEAYNSQFNDQLKKQIKQRDNLTCQLCGIKKDLCIHHIDYDKKNSNSNNLITLCRSCHNKIHSRRKRLFWQTYFNLNILIGWKGKIKRSEE